MMRIHPLLVAATLAVLPLAAQAQWYAGPALMTGFSDERDIEDSTGAATGIFDNNDGNVIIGASGLLGYDFTESGAPFALEFSGNWRARHDMDIGYINGVQQGVKSNVQTLDFTASVLYDLPLGTDIQPYIGAGIGVAYAELESEHLVGVTMNSMADNDTTNFAWQLQGGVKYPLDDSMKLRIDYRYIDIGEIETSAAPGGEQFTANMYSHDVRMGVTWDF